MRKKTLIIEGITDYFHCFIKATKHGITLKDENQEISYMWDAWDEIVASANALRQRLENCEKCEGENE